MDMPIHTAWIIDDDEIYKYGFCKYVRMKNFCADIIDFSNGKKAIDYLMDPHNAWNLPDIIFLDIEMPVMNGWEFIRAFGEIKKQLQKKIVINMVTSSLNYQDIVRAKTHTDITNYIIKPIDFQEFDSAFKTGYQSHPLL